MPALYQRPRAVKFPYERDNTASRFMTVQPSQDSRECMNIPHVRDDALSRVVTVPPVPRAVTAAREWSRQTIKRWRLEQAAEAIEHLVSELVTNSVEHARCVSVTVLLIYAVGTLRLEVSDQDADNAPVLKSPKPGDMAGRGLVIVQALSDRWGVRVTNGGKTVWCELTVEPKGC